MTTAAISTAASESGKLGSKVRLIIASPLIFLATLIRSAFGFGEALVAVPLLALLMPVEEAVPLATLVSITVATIVVAQDWRKIHLGVTARPLPYAANTVSL